MKRTRNSIIDQIEGMSHSDLVELIKLLPDLDFQRLAFAFFLYKQLTDGKRVNVRKVSMIVGVHRSVGDRILSHMRKRLKMYAQTYIDIDE